MESPRLGLARRTAVILEGRLGRDLLATGVTGSVARGTDRRHSDVDLVFLVRRRVAWPRFQVREGSLVTFLQETREEAWGEVCGAHLGLPEALAGWRSMCPLYDPTGLLRRLIARARRTTPAQFRGAARLEILGAFEDLGKIRNAVDARDPGAAREFAIWYTGGAALALLDLRRRVPASDGSIFAETAGLGPLGRGLCRLRYGPLSVSETAELAERTWAGLLREARRQGIPVRDLR